MAFNQRGLSKTMTFKQKKAKVEDAKPVPITMPAIAQDVLTEKLADQAAKQAESKWKQYFLPKSLTWWSGVAGIALGVAQAAGIAHPAFGVAGTVLAAITGGDFSGSPAALIVAGAGLIGIRAKLTRQI